MLQRLFQRFVSVSDRSLLMMRLDTQRRQVHLPSQPYSLRRKSNDPTVSYRNGNGCLPHPNTIPRRYPPKYIRSSRLSRIGRGQRQRPPLSFTNLWKAAEGWIELLPLVDGTLGLIADG